MLDFRLMAISNSALFSDSSEWGRVESTIIHFRQLADTGLKAYQLREKSWSDQSRFVIAKTLSEIARAQGVSLLINDRPDIAAMVQARGVHLPEHGWPIRAARSILKNGLIGKSCHSIPAAIQAQQNGSDYILFGPVFETESKKAYGPPLGIAKLREVCESVHIPVFAVGGISAARAAECRAAGANGVAVIGALSGANQFGQTLRDFEVALGGL